MRQVSFMHMVSASYFDDPAYPAALAKTVERALAQAARTVGEQLLPDTIRETGKTAMVWDYDHHEPAGGHYIPNALVPDKPVELWAIRYVADTTDSRVGADLPEGD